jgi:hypothetical protein
MVTARKLYLDFGLLVRSDGKIGAIDVAWMRAGNKLITL